MAGHRVFGYTFSKIYSLYIQKAERKNRTKEEVDEVIRWLTGYTQAQLEAQIENGVTLEAFYDEAPAFNPHSALIKGVVCGVRVETLEDPMMRKLRYLDKLIDELAKGKAMEKVLRKPTP